MNTETLVNLTKKIQPANLHSLFRKQYLVFFCFQNTKEFI